jgi:hypothetical protein
MLDDRTRTRAQFLLSSMLTETQRALLHLQHVRPRIFARGLANTVLNADRLAEVGARLDEAIPSIRSGNALDWDALEEVGLTGGPLEWKAELLYVCLGRPKPDEEVARLNFGPEREILTYSEGKPIWSRLFKYLKSLFGSLINGVKSDSKVRLALDFIKEFVECVEASLRFVQSGAET